MSPGEAPALTVQLTVPPLRICCMCRAGSPRQTWTLRFDNAAPDCAKYMTLYGWLHDFGRSASVPLHRLRLVLRSFAAISRGTGDLARVARSAASEPRSE